MHIICFILSSGPKRARTHGKDIAPESDELTFPELLSKFNLEDLPLFEVEVLAAATNNFSDANKLGKGGFGPVYKVKSPVNLLVRPKHTLLAKKMKHLNHVVRACCKMEEKLQ